MSGFLKEKYKLSRNPFPPAAAGIDIERGVYVPPSWIKKIEEHYETLSKGGGVKAFPIRGEYGSGKTVLLKSHLKEFFEEKTIMPFYFENPGVQFYDLANTLMRNLGRLEFSKALWEMIRPHYTDKGQKLLYPMSFVRFLDTLKTKRDREDKTNQISGILKDKLQLTDDEEVAYKLALTIVETASKPYFEYRDFIAGRKGSLVAEREEPKYFKALINSVMKIYNVEGVAFLIDEFEDVAISKRMPRLKSYEYLATLRHLIDISQEENFWIIIAMTPQAATSTKEMNEALWQRFTTEETTVLELGPLTSEESKDLIIWWLNRARGKSTDLFPFPDELMDFLDTCLDIRLPRSLIKMCFLTTAKAEEQKIDPPIPIGFIKDIAKDFCPPIKNIPDEINLQSEMLENDR